MTTTSTGRRLRTLFTGITAAALLGVGLAPAAQAHNTLISSSPEDGATLDAVPDEVVLTFNADVNDGGNGIVVTGPDGADHAEGEVELDGPEASIAIAPLTEAGEYTIDYRIVSADGHPLSDTLTFTLDEAAVPEPVESEPAPAGEEPAGEEPAASPAADEAPADPLSPTGPLGPVVGVLGGVAAIALVAIVIIRIRRRPGSGK
ncbi:copper resistance CopC family protein [Actinorugispora endophytica]|nr:copper resistance CopC family protein [Actinorugispora endophytica]